MIKGSSMLSKGLLDSRTGKLWRIRLFSFFLILSPSLSHALDVRGYVKGFLENYSLPGERATVSGDYWSEFFSTRFTLMEEFSSKMAFEGSYQVIPFYGRTFIALYNVRNLSLKSYRIYDLGLFLVDPSKDRRDSFSMLQNLDRVLFTYTSDKVIATVGRQIVTFGSAKVINPTDVVTPLGLNTIDTEERPGSDAARIKYFLSPKFSLDGGFLAGHSLLQKFNGWFFRAVGNFLKNDVYLMLMKFRGDNYLYGLNWEGSIGGATGWVEASFATGQKDYFRLSGGMQYFFVGQWSLIGEYHYNGIGTIHEQDYFKVAMTRAFSSANLFLMGKDYFSLMINKDLSPLTNLGLGTTANLHDWSTLISLIFQWNLAENNYLNFTYFNGIGAHRSEFFLYPSNLVLEYRFYY
jgi:hypothetical protein